MNCSFSVAVVAVLVIAGCSTGQGTQTGAASPSIGEPHPSPAPIATATPATPTTPTTPTVIASPSASAALTGFPEGPLKAGTHTAAPLNTANGEGVCHAPPQPGCSEPPSGDDIRFTITVPDGWEGVGAGIWLAGPGNGPPDGAGVLFGRGGWLLSDPCQATNPDVSTGTTVADFVDAVVAHPILDTTPPVDVELAEYAGEYFDLQVPADLSTCEFYRPWEPGIYAQGPSHQWHQWVLDVDGDRVVVQSFDFPGTSAEDRAELQAIVDSIKIEP